MKQTLRT